ncbi:antibiotic biosynthesis monooxygenase [Exiguobacterium sp. Helios]|uniref:putative quinol monooxygenase n=1 Tax=Exiguobacterium sp. Helios TaxID=2735868 RepID=UPI00165D3352|nr:antibiotic biosynthesis monooxygenase [Exiguobacterium sp. Helios]QNR21120.1 antibiotic biosynthesis monooxygenase [Exiguobacterium sp. Helios]
MYYGLLTKFTTQLGAGNRLAELLLEAASSLEHVTDCRQYVVSMNDEPDTVMVREIWTDQAAHMASLQLPATQKLIEQARPILLHVERVLEDQPHGGKGLK